MAQAVEKIEQQQSSALTPMDMIERAITSGAGIEMIEKLMVLQERWDANQARKAFNEAMAAARAKFKPIIKNRHVGFAAKNGGARTDYNHEDMAAIAEAVDPILAEFGLSYRYRTTNAPNEPVIVTCILFHNQGHSEETTLRGPPDNSGNKNVIQQVGSTVTFLQRYTLKAALGLSVAAKDDDGNASEQIEVISDEQMMTLRDLMESVGAVPEAFCKIFKVEAVSALPVARYDEAIKRLNEYGQARKAGK